MEKARGLAEQNGKPPKNYEDNLPETDKKRFLELRETFNKIIGNSNIRAVLNSPDLDRITRELKELLKKAEGGGK